MLRSSLCDYRDGYILASSTITITGAEGNHAAKQIDERSKGVIFKNCAPFTDWISEINNTQIDNVKYIDGVMPMYNLIEYSDNYSKISGSLWQYYRDEPALDNNGASVNFPGNSASFKFKQKITGSTRSDDTKAVQIMVPLTYLSNFWRTLEISLIKCEINPILTWSANCVISNAAANQETTFAISNAKLYVPKKTIATIETRIQTHN